MVIDDCILTQIRIIKNAILLMNNKLLFIINIIYYYIFKQIIQFLVD